MANDVVESPFVELPPDGVRVLRDNELQVLFKAAAEAGAISALRRVGLSDEKAGKDIADMRDWMASWRAARSKFWEAAISVFTKAILFTFFAGLISGFAYGLAKLGIIKLPPH